MRYWFIILTVVLLLSGCGPSATTPINTSQQSVLSDNKSAPTPLNVSVSANETAAASVPKAPTVASAPTSKPVSWGESNTYVNDTYGISLMYPKSWITHEASGDQVFVAVASDSQVNPAAVTLTIIAASADIPSAVKATIQAIAYMRKVNIISTNKILLSDGKTPATEVVAALTTEPSTDVYALAVSKADKLIIAAGRSWQGEASRSLVREIVSTLAVK
jgi:uncharacterized protein YcfL